jgi:glutathione peroxidase
MNTRKLIGAVSGFFVLVGLTVVHVFAKDVVKNTVKEPSAPSTTQPAPDYKGPLSFTVKDIDGKEVNLADYRGKVVMILNVASRCGNTKQYTALEATYQKYKDKGLVIIGFPANNFGGQEPGTEQDIKTFCSSKYNVTFPMMSKISVKGEDKHPLFKYLTEQPTAGEEFAGEVDWNFGKFLVDRNGQVYARFAAGTTPDSAQVVEAIEKGLAK